MKITSTENGPNKVEIEAGSWRVVRDGTEETIERTTIFLCRCGHSENKPFCDGTHNKIGFVAPLAEIELQPGELIAGVGSAFCRPLEPAGDGCNARRALWLPEQGGRELVCLADNRLLLGDNASARNEQRCPCGAGPSGDACESRWRSRPGLRCEARPSAQSRRQGHCAALELGYLARDASSSRS